MKMRWIAVLIIGWIAFGFASCGQDGGFQGTVSGRKTWTIRYGFGDPLALALAGLSPGQLSLDQTLAVEIKGEALGILSIEGSFNDQESSSLQSLAVYLDTERLDGVAGDFTVPEMGSFSAYSRKMKGARLDYQWGIGTLTAIVSQLEGVSESKTFVGQTALVTRIFAFAEAGSAEPKPYESNLEGLISFVLESLYVEEFSSVATRIGTGSDLDGVLARYGVTALAPALDGHQGRTLLASEFSVVDGSPQRLVLRASPSALVRRNLVDAIAVYNDGADSATRIVYPFAGGSEAEAAFLNEVAALTAVIVGDDRYLLTQADRRQFYDLGQTGVVLDSVDIEIDPNGSGYRFVSNPEWLDYQIAVFCDEGVLEIHLPDAFYSDADASIRVQFSYSVLGGAYMLGLSVIPKSERVMLNGRVLVRDVDYMIDYEIGFVALFIPAADDDEIQVEFERYAGGLGGAGNYARYFSGLVLNLPLSEALSFDGYLLQAADDAGSARDASSVSMMPNRQIVAGVSCSLWADDFSASGVLGYGNDRFPFDDNARAPIPNRIRSFGVGSGFVLVGHDAGFAVREGETWRSYGTADGLSGRSVRAIAVGEATAFFGTSAGLTRVELAGISPFDRVGNWKRYYVGDGLPNASVRALLLDGGQLWVGTDGGLAVVNVASIDSASDWRTVLGSEYGEIRAVGREGDLLYVGTANGLVQLNLAGGQADLVEETRGAPIHALWIAEGVVYVASERGLRTYVDGAGTGWVVWGAPVYAVAAYGGELYYGTGAGLVRAADGAALYAGWKVTALAADGGALWAGTEADDEYRLWVWAIGAGEAGYDNATMKIDGQNPYLYQDISADDHTAEGWMAEGSFTHSTEFFSLSGTVNRILPGYRAIGNTSRTDDGGWTLDGEVDLGPDLRLGLFHSYQMRDLSTAGRVAVLENELRFHSAVGPAISFALQQESEDSKRSIAGSETDQISYQFSVGQTLFGSAASVFVDWKETLLWDVDAAFRRDSVLSTSVQATFMPDWSSGFSWSRPIHVAGDAWSGSERLTWGIDGRVALPSVDALTEYDFGWSRSLPNGTSKTTHAGRIRLAVDTMTWEGGQFAPSVDLSGKLDDGTPSFSGRLNLRTTWANLAGRTVISVDASGLGEAVERWTEKLSSTWSYSGIEGLRPVVTYSGNRTFAVYEGRESASTFVHSLNGRLTWTSPMGDSDSFSFSFRVEPGEEGSASGSLDNSYQRDVTSLVASWLPPAAEGEASPYPSVVVRGDASGDWDFEHDGSNFGWTLTGGADVLLSAMWSASLEATVHGGKTQSGTWYHGLLFGLTVAIDF